ncbi:hypothetical protein HYDPIDRAFT_108020 [Hydnomerulius pinastri MD-312]|nr:hypothetical protein HYDPIDRAFT_108020 [Hydnomerulius pinastri MD-312]
MASLAYMEPPPDLTQQIMKLENGYCDGGSFGDVYRCRCNTATGWVEVAVKALRFKLALDEDRDENGRGAKILRRELGIWRRLDHPNIVPFLGVVSGFGPSVSLVSMWMPNGTLHAYLGKCDSSCDSTSALSPAQRLRLIVDIASGLEYLHSIPVVHGDLTSSNVLVDGNCSARLVDFGYSTVVGEIPEALGYLQRTTHRPGALRWVAPEQLQLGPDQANKPTPKSDIYSLGSLAFQILSGKQPWSEVLWDATVIFQLASGQTPGRPTSRPIDDDFWGFIQCCWSRVEDRPSAEAAVLHLQGMRRLVVPLDKQFDRTYAQLVTPLDKQQFDRTCAQLVAPLDKQQFDRTYAQFCQSQHNADPCVALPNNHLVDLHQLHAHVLREGGSELVTQRDQWSVIGGRMGLPDSWSEEPLHSIPTTAQHLAHVYKNHLQDFENAYIETMLYGAGGSTPQEMTTHQSGPTNLQIMSIVELFALMSVSDMRAQGLSEPFINLVDINRRHLITYQQQQDQLLAKRNAEQGRQVMNAQGQSPKVQEQINLGIQPMVSNTMPAMPNGEQNPMTPRSPTNLPEVLTRDQIRHAVTAVSNLKQIFLKRCLDDTQTEQIPKEQRLDYHNHLERVFKMTSDLEIKLPLYHIIFKDDDLLRSLVAIVTTVSKQRQFPFTSSQCIMTPTNLLEMQMQIEMINEVFDTRWRAILMAAIIGAHWLR